MALVILGKTICHLCGRVIEEGDEIESFPPMAVDAADPLADFSDAGVHRECLENDPRGRAASALLEEVLAARDFSRTCEVCAELITDPDDYFSFGILTSRRTDPLYRFNLRTFHRSHLGRWQDAGTALELIRARSREFPSGAMNVLAEQIERGL